MLIVNAVGVKCEKSVSCELLEKPLLLVFCQFKI